MNITTEQYERIQSSAPKDYSSVEFLLFLRENNVVVLETPEWLVIENIKHHTKESPWYTAFDKGCNCILDYKLQLLQWEFPEYRYLLNSVYTAEIRMPYVHLLRADSQYVIKPNESFIS